MTASQILSASLVLNVVLLVVIAALAVLLALYRSRNNYLERKTLRCQKTARSAGRQLRRQQSVQCLFEHQTEAEAERLRRELHVKTALLQQLEKQLSNSEESA